ncbi:hypothetical protein E4U53_008156 [Claviceps sorghi]|nr:hypothetical protein E4U53_008156 [Claviceps sorghi]
MHLHSWVSRTNFGKVLNINQDEKSALMQSPPSFTTSSISYISVAASVDPAAPALAPTASSFETIIGGLAHDETNMEDMHKKKGANDDLLSALVKALTPVPQRRKFPDTSNIGPGQILTITDASSTATGQMSALATSSSTSTRTHSELDTSSSLAAARADTQHGQSSDIPPGLDGPAQRDNDDAKHQDTELALSLLDDMSVLVINVAIHSVSLAARLTDAMLIALPVDAMAISAVISAAAGQSSTSTETMIPFILPAVAVAFGRQVDISTEEPVDTAAQNLTKTYETIVNKGSYMINQIIAASFLAETPLLDEVLSQLVGVVYVFSTKLNQTMCALKLDKRELAWQILLPCASVNLGSSAPASALALNPGGSVLGESHPASPEMAGLKMVPVASAEPKTFLISDMKMPLYYSGQNSAADGHLLRGGEYDFKFLSHVYGQADLSVSVSVSVSVLSLGWMAKPSSGSRATVENLPPVREMLEWRVLPGSRNATTDCPLRA